MVAVNGLPFRIPQDPSATTRAAILEARQVRARYETSKNLIDGLRGKRAKKKGTHKAVRRGRDQSRLCGRSIRAFSCSAKYSE